MALPRAPQVVLPILRAAHPGVTFQARLDAEFLAMLPYAHVRFGERDILHPRLRLDVPITVHSTVAGDDAAADLLATGIHLALWNAVQLQTTVPGIGHLCALQILSGPQDSPLPGQPAGVCRYAATYQLGIRPAPVSP